MLEHRNSNVTRAVYVHEIKDAERKAKGRARMEARYGSALEGSTAAAGSRHRPRRVPKWSICATFAARRSRAQQPARFF